MWVNSDTGMQKDTRKLGRMWPCKQEGLKQSLQYVKITVFFHIENNAPLVLAKALSHHLKSGWEPVD